MNALTEVVFKHHACSWKILIFNRGIQVTDMSTMKEAVILI